VGNAARQRTAPFPIHAARLERLDGTDASRRAYLAPSRQGDQQRMIIPALLTARALRTTGTTRPRRSLLGPDSALDEIGHPEHF
jgi:hypothetical protein